MKGFDAVVVGAGPAGSAAALALLRHGAKVALVEREPLPRYKTCGGGVVPRAVRYAGVSIAAATEKTFDRAAFHLHDIDRRFALSRTGAVITMTMRERLDFLLAEAAAGAGAELLAPCRVRDVTATNGGVRLGTDSGELVADFVVAADGAIADVARLAGWPDDRRLIPALEYEVRVDDPTLRRLGAEPRFDVGTVPYGYAWVFPKAAHLSIGVLSMRRGAGDLHEQLEQYQRLLGIERPVEVTRHGFVIPVRPRSGPLLRGRVAVVGDAAGLADPVTAEGISFAIRSGQLAGEAIAVAQGDEARAHDAYLAALRQEILPELRAGRLLARLLYDHVTVRRWLFERYGRQLIDAFATGFLGGEGFRDLPKRIVRRLVGRR